MWQTRGVKCQGEARIKMRKITNMENREWKEKLAIISFFREERNKRVEIF